MVWSKRFDLDCERLLVKPDGFDMVALLRLCGSGFSSQFAKSWSCAFARKPERNKNRTKQDQRNHNSGIHLNAPLQRADVIFRNLTFSGVPFRLNENRGPFPCTVGPSTTGGVKPENFFPGQGGAILSKGFRRDFHVLKQIMK